MKEYPSRSCLSINWVDSFPLLFFFSFSTAWFLWASFDHTLSSTAGCYINKFTWWVLRSRDHVLREQDMWGAEPGICLYCFSCLKDLSWDHFSYVFFAWLGIQHLFWSIAAVSWEKIPILRVLPMAENACSRKQGLPPNKDSRTRLKRLRSSSVIYKQCQDWFQCCSFHLPSPLALGPLD